MKLKLRNVRPNLFFIDDVSDDKDNRLTRERWFFPREKRFRLHDMTSAGSRNSIDIWSSNLAEFRAKLAAGFMLYLVQ